MRRITTKRWRCDTCGARRDLRADRRPVVMRVNEPGGFETRVVTVNGAVVHQCRLDTRVIAGQLEFRQA